MPDDGEAVASATVRDVDEDGDEVSTTAGAAPTVVVTGAAGWLGQNLVRALAAQPARRSIRCLVHESADASLLEVIDPRIEVVAGDVRAPNIAGASKWCCYAKVG